MARSSPLTHLLQELDGHRGHVLRSLDGLSEPALDRSAAPSGWTPRTMLSHLRFDVEIFWVHAVLGADPGAIEQLRDGWSAPPLPGPELLSAYRSDIARSTGVLTTLDPEAPPAWRPPTEVFGGPWLDSGWEVILRVLSETAVHAGHLDMAREAIDGRQDLVVT